MPFSISVPAGLVRFYPASRPELILPLGGAELVISAVKREDRGNGVGTVLIRAALNERHRLGRTVVMTDWRCAHPVSSRFWMKTGFKPIAHRPVRRLDSLCLPGRN